MAAARTFFRRRVLPCSGSVGILFTRVGAVWLDELIIADSKARIATHVDIVEVACCPGGTASAMSKSTAASTAAASSVRSRGGRAPAAAGWHVQVGGELGEGSQFAIWASARRTPPPSFLIDLGLGCTTDARHRDTGVDGGTDTGVERVGSRKIWPSVIEITLVGTNAETSPACVSDDGQGGQRTGLALDLAVELFGQASDARRRAPAGGSAGKRRPGRLHGQADGAAAAKPGDTPRPAWSDRHNDQRVHAAVGKYSPIAAGVGADELHGGRFDAAATTMVYSIAPFSSSLRTTLAMVEAFGRWPRIDTVHVLALLVDDGVDATAVLPVWRSPMISSRWLRPTGPSSRWPSDRSAPAGTPTYGRSRPATFRSCR